MNNKYLKMALGLPLFMTLATGCLQVNDYPDTIVDEAGRYSLGIASLSASETAPQTRAATVKSLPASSQVGFFLQAQSPDYVAMDNQKGGYDADKSLWLPADSIWLTGVDAQLAVYYPYDASQTTPGQLKLRASVRTDDSKDIWSARFKANSRTQNIKLTMTQLYSRLRITFVKVADAEYTGASALTQLQLKGAGIYADATYNPMDGTYVNGTAGYTATLTDVTITGANPAADNATEVDLLLPPCQNLTDDITLTATVDTKEMNIVISKTNLSNALLPGKQYNLLVKLKPKALVLGEVKTTDWDSQTAWGEEMGFVKSLPDYLEIAGLDFFIARSNVVATKNAIDDYTYAFAPEPGYFDATNSKTGDYFCWNMLEPTGKITQTNWLDSRDACRQIGDGEWRTPTRADLTALSKTDYIWAGYIMENKSTVDGIFFGTKTVPGKANQDKYPFFPIAGYREDNSFNQVSTNGYYWSNTLDDGQTTISSALCIMGGTCTIGGRYNYYGFFLRCVRPK